MTPDQLKQEAASSFRLVCDDPQLADNLSVRAWLEQVAALIRAELLRNKETA